MVAMDYAGVISYPAVISDNVTMESFGILPVSGRRSEGENGVCMNSIPSVQNTKPTIYTDV